MTCKVKSDASVDQQFFAYYATIVCSPLFRTWSCSCAFIAHHVVYLPLRSFLRCL